MVERLRLQKKRKMTSFRIDEISAVDRGANPHARMTIMKRADSADDPPASFDSFEAACGHLRKVRGLGALASMEQAARDHPDLVEKHNQEGRDRVAKAMERMRSPTVPPAVATFRRLVQTVRDRDMCSGPEAMTRARAEFPQEFAAYQGA